MSSIFSRTNLQQDTVYQSLDFSGKGFIKARYSLVGATIQCFIKSTSGGNSVSIGNFSNTISRLDIPVAYQQDKVKLEFISDKNLSYLQVDFEAQYNYVFGLGSQQENGGIPNSSFKSSSVVNLNATTLIVPYSVNNFARDLIYALGAIEGGYSGVAPSVVEVTANSTEAGDSNQLLNKNSSGWYSSNVAGGYLTLDFGKNKTTRTIVNTGLGFQGSQSGAIGSPMNLIISGSNNGTSFTTIQTWSGLGITAAYQWKFLIFPNSIAYRYIRIAQSGLNNANTNYFSCASLNFYGTINNP